MVLDQILYFSWIPQLCCCFASPPWLLLSVTTAVYKFCQCLPSTPKPQSEHLHGGKPELSCISHLEVFSGREGLISIYFLMFLTWCKENLKCPSFAFFLFQLSHFYLPWWRGKLELGALISNFYTTDPQPRAPSFQP